MFSSIPGLYPVDATNSQPPSCDSQKCLQTVPSVSQGDGGGKYLPLVKTTGGT